MIVEEYALDSLVRVATGPFEAARALSVYKKEGTASRRMLPFCDLCFMCAIAARQSITIVKPASSYVEKTQSA